MPKEGRICERCGKARLRAGNPGVLCGACSRAEASAGDVPELPVEFWFRPEVAAACMDWDLGKIFRYVLDETRISEERFGRLIGRSQAQVWRIANQRSECYDIRVFKAVVDAFGCPALLLGLAPSGTDLVAEVHKVRNGLEPHAGRFGEVNDFVHAFDRLNRTRRPGPPS